MNIKVPKVIRKLELAGYEPEFDAVLEVWVNPPRELLINEFKLRTESTLLVEILDQTDKDDEQSVEVREKTIARIAEVGKERMKIYSELWSQGSENSRMSAEEIETMIETVFSSEPNLFNWMTDSTLAMINDHREIQKKG